MVSVDVSEVENIDYMHHCKEGLTKQRRFRPTFNTGCRFVFAGTGWSENKQIPVFLYTTTHFGLHVCTTVDYLWFVVHLRTANLA